MCRPCWNAFPDTFSFLPVTTIPKGTRLAFTPAAGDSLDTTISLQAQVHYSVQVPLSFSVPDSAQIVVADSERLKGAGDALRRLQVTEAAFHIAVKNTSGLSLCIIGVAAPQSSKQTLFGLPPPI